MGCFYTRLCPCLAGKKGIRSCRKKGQDEKVFYCFTQLVFPSSCLSLLPFSSSLIDPSLLPRGQAVRFSEWLPRLGLRGLVKRRLVPPVSLTSQAAQTAREPGDELINHTVGFCSPPPKTCSALAARCWCHLPPDSSKQKHYTDFKAAGFIGFSAFLIQQHLDI